MMHRAAKGVVVGSFCGIAVGATVSAVLAASSIAVITAASGQIGDLLPGLLYLGFLGAWIGAIIGGIVGAVVGIVVSVALVDRLTAGACGIIVGATVAAVVMLSQFPPITVFWYLPVIGGACCSGYVVGIALTMQRGRRESSNPEEA